MPNYDAMVIVKWGRAQNITILHINMTDDDNRGVWSADTPKVMTYYMDDP